MREKNTILTKIDHKVLNDNPDLKNPTSEYICKWIWKQLSPKLKGLSKLVLSEDHGTGIIYKGE